MDYIDTTEKLLKSLNDLLSALNRQINCGEDTFLHQASQFVQFAITTSEKRDPMLKKQINKGIDFIVSSISSLVTKVVFSGTLYNAIFFVSQEIGEFFKDRSIPKIMCNKYDAFVRLLDTALEKKRNIEASCSKLLDEVVTACKSYCCTYGTVRGLEAERLKISAKIRDCEQPVLIARELLEELLQMAKSEAVRHGFKCGAAGLATIGFGYGALQEEDTLRRVIFGIAALGSGVLCYKMAEKLGDFKHVWDELNTKRIQYQEIYYGLESLKEIIGRELKQGIHLIETPDFSVPFILVILVAFFAVMYAFFYQGSYRVLLKS